jgi:hypothetical protein
LRWTYCACFLTFFTFICISIRSPGSVAPRDVECEGFGITYPRIASDNKSSRPAGTASIPDPLENDVDKKVDDAIESFLRKLSQIGPELMSVRSIFLRVVWIRSCECKALHIIYLTRFVSTGFLDAQLL